MDVRGGRAQRTTGRPGLILPVWALHLDADLDEANLAWAALTAAGMVGAAEVDGRAAVYFAQRPTAAPLPGRWERVADRDWHERWRAGLTPVRAGRWTVTPPWLSTAAADELIIDPGQAFGTGDHETTRQSLDALDGVALPERTVLDVGTGTGVLAIAAARGGAWVTAIDIDPLAVAAARDNAHRNGVTIEVLAVGIDDLAGRTFDVVVANLDSATLIASAPALHAALAVDGLLIAGGVSNVRGDEVCAALERSGLRVQRAAGTEWSLLRGERAGP